MCYMHIWSNTMLRVHVLRSYVHLYNFMPSLQYIRAYVSIAALTSLGTCPCENGHAIFRLANLRCTCTSKIFRIPCKQQLASFHCWGLMSGSMPTTCSTRTSGPTTSRYVGSYYFSGLWFDLFIFFGTADYMVRHQLAERQPALRGRAEQVVAEHSCSWMWMFN